MNKKGFLIKFICGFFIGFGFIVPGVSGSAVAMMFDVYNDMLDSVSNIFKTFKKSFIYLLPIGLGVILSALSLYFPLMFLLKKNCFAIIMLFAGMLAGGLKPIVKKVEWKTKNKWNYLGFVLAFLFVIGISLSSFFIKDFGIDLKKPNAVNYIMVFVCGILFAISTIVPGVSGTALLLAVGYYYPLMVGVMGDILSFNFNLYSILIMVDFALGLVIGVFIISKLIKVCFDKFNTATYMIISGFAIGSIPAMFISQDWGKPRLEEVYIKLPLEWYTIVLGVALLISGFALTYYLMSVKEKKERSIE